jgi:hypothetical protein
VTNLERWQIYTKDIESPDLFIRWGFYASISSALSRRVWYRSNPITKQPDHNSLFVNFFILLCAPPSVGKGRVMGQMIALLTDKNLEFVVKGTTLTDSPVKVGADAGTLESIYKSLNDDVRTFTHKATVAGKEDVVLSCAHSSCSFLIEELGVFLTKDSEAKVHFLNHAFDCKNVNYETKHQGKFRITNCCVNVVAGAYPEFIRDNPKLIVQGFQSRLIILYDDAPRFRKLFEGIDPTGQQHYSHLVSHVKELSTKVVGEITYSKEALDFLREIYPTLDDRKNRINKESRLDHYYGRKNIHLQKLAAVIHFSERADSMVVEKESLVKALEELARIEIRMGEAFRASGMNKGYEVGVQIVRYLESKPEGATYKRLLLDFTRDLTKMEFDERLQILVTTGQVKVENNVYKKV